MITNHNLGNPEWANLPRKFNIAVSGTRDDYSHTHINDIGFQAVPHAASGIIGFNVVLGGYFSAKRVATSLELDLWVPPGQVLNLCYSVLRVREGGNLEESHGSRAVSKSVLWDCVWGKRHVHSLPVRILKAHPPRVLSSSPSSLPSSLPPSSSGTMGTEKTGRRPVCSG